MTARHRKTGISLISLVFGTLAACTSYTEIPIETPIQPKLDVTPFQRIFVAGFIAASAPNTKLRRLTPVFLCRAVIDFLEQVVVLPNERIVGFELEGFFVGLSRLCQLTFVLVGHGEVIERCGVGWIKLGGVFPTVDRLFPQTLLRDLDPELHLLLGLTPLVGPRCGNRRHSHEQGKHQNACSHGYQRKDFLQSL